MTTSGIHSIVKYSIDKLNYTKLNLFFNYINKDGGIFEKISINEKQGIISTLMRMQLYTGNNFSFLVSRNTKLEWLLQYWAIKELYVSPYKIYLDKLKRDDFIHEFLKTKEYVQIKGDDYTEFMNYFITCLRNFLKIKKGIN